MQVDGMDLRATYEMLQEAAEYARSGKGSFFLEVITYRYRGHSMGDPERYRDVHEVEEKKADDPIVRWAAYLKENKLVTDETLAEMDQSAEQEVLNAVEFARNSPIPQPEELYANVYA
jgi:pyruvate dehydrogenase E1 component alpha subunit